MSDGENFTTSSQQAELSDDLADRPIHCIDCQAEFTWTCGEQSFFRDKGLGNPPKRCKACKRAKNQRIEAVARAHATGEPQRIEVRVNCASCGESTTVPFYPSQGRPVLCRACFLRGDSTMIHGAGSNGAL